MDKSKPTRLNFAKLFFVLPLFFTSGCTTNYYVDKNAYPDKTNDARETVYVTNPEHVDYATLKAADIYPLSDQPNEVTSLTLQPKIFASVPIYCGLGTFMTFGLIPEKCPYEEKLSYTLTQGHKEQHYHHIISYYSLTSLWETALLPFRNSQETIRIKALSSSNRQKQITR